MPESPNEPDDSSAPQVQRLKMALDHRITRLHNQKHLSLCEMILIRFSVHMMCDFLGNNNPYVLQLMPVIERYTSTNNLPGDSEG